MKSKKPTKELTPGQARAKARLEKQAGAKGPQMEIKLGSHLYRLLKIEGEEDKLEFCIEEVSHYIGGETIKCLTTEFGGSRGTLPTGSTPCPRCRQCLKGINRSNKLFERGSEEGREAFKAAIKEYGPSWNYYSFAFYADDYEDGELYEVGVIKYGQTVLDALLHEYCERHRNFFFTKTGRLVNITKKKKVGKNNYHEYSASVTDDRSNLTDIWPELKASFPDIRKNMAKAMDADTMKTFIADMEVQYEEEKVEEKKPKKKSRFETSSDDSDDDDEDEDKADEEEEEKPKAKKKSSALEKEKKKLRAKAGIEDDDDSDEEDEEREEEEDEPAPPRKSKRPSRDEDDDGEEADEDDDGEEADEDDE